MSTLRTPHPRLRGSLLLAFLAIATCSFPTDESDRVFVTVASLDTRLVVRRGGKLHLYARMYHALGGDTIEIHNVRFAWTSDNEEIATVEAGSLGSAEVTGVNSGVVSVNARAVAFEQAQSDRFVIRVSNPVEIDSIKPSTVRFGDTVRVYGVGVDSIFFVTLEDAGLIEYPFTRTRDSLGFSEIAFWIPPPARSGQVLYFGNGVFGLAPDSTRVIPADIFEPNDVAPRLRSLELPRPFPGTILGPVLFTNPALAFEPIKRDLTFGVDWYRFSQTTPRDLTLIVQGTEVRGTFATFLTDSLEYVPSDSSYLIGPDSWTIGPSDHACHGYGFTPLQVQPESTIVALAGVPAGAVHAIAFYSQPGRYGVTVVEGYVVSRTLFPRDDREEDDYCNRADARVVPIPPAGTGSWRDTLTIDNPHDVDWIRFRVPDPGGGASQTVAFRTAGLVTGTVDTVSDVDLYILTQPAAGLAEVASGQRAGSAESFTAFLPPGDYYAVAVDYSGEPTRYAICIGVGLGSCALGFPAPLGAPQLSADPQRLKPKSERQSSLRSGRTRAP